VQPERHAEEWKPTYNIIELNLHGQANPRELSISVWTRIWNRQKMQFDSGNESEDDNPKKYIVRLKSPTTIKDSKKEASSSQKGQQKMADEPETLTIDSPDPVRVLVFRFLSISYNDKMRIAVKLNLIEESDRDLLEFERNKAYFERIKERNQYRQVWEELNKISNTSETNPF
jgi:hypothetical protein